MLREAVTCVPMCAVSGVNYCLHRVSLPRSWILFLVKSIRFVTPRVFKLIIIFISFVHSIGQFSKAVSSFSENLNENC